MAEGITFTRALFASAKIEEHMTEAVLRSSSLISAIHSKSYSLNASLSQARRIVFLRSSANKICR